MALVTAIAQELVKQVAVSAMDLHPIEPCGDGMAGRQLESLHNRRQFLVGQFPRHDIGLLAFRGINRVTRNRDRTRGHRLQAAIEQGMAGTAAMPELQHDLST